ncbi:Hypothetical predicted protein [Cloeon dipterum]|uniref:4'-phosphopantetheine phosphatase n=1 Tax=Cloeon dipterum TaxID=197152 RepID=A0A8S1DGV7_9INSE|nr:Hypothetical predicted protein [Cloeon dipterum]
MEKQCKMNGRLKDSLPSIPSDLLLNPFVHHLELTSTLDKIKTALLTVTFLPLRVLCIGLLLSLAWVLACVGLVGLDENDVRCKPLTGWRRSLRAVISKLVRLLMVFGSFHTVKVKGRQATQREAPVLILAPHSSFFDALPVVLLGSPSIVAKAETANIPFFGKLINYTQPVYVWRDDPTSRQKTIKEIVNRATSKLEWPQILIFPEGTCTNRKCLITFKLGAFYPGVPVQPVCIRYPNELDTVTWTWEGPGALKLLWLTLTRWNSTCEIEFLPVYKPSEEEKNNPKLFANNVRNVMAKALQIPVSDYNYSDTLLIKKAVELNLPSASDLVKVQKLRHKIGLNCLELEVQQASKLLNKDLCSLEEFAKVLNVSAGNDAVQELFQLYVKNGVRIINIREYLLDSIVINMKSKTEEMARLAFEAVSSDPTRMSRDEAVQALKISLKMSEERADRIFDKIESVSKFNYDSFVNGKVKEAASASIMTDKTNPIELPDNIRVFDNLRNAKRFAIDIGGSLTKIAYYSTTSQRTVFYGPLNKDEQEEASLEEALVYEISEGARLHFIKFETRFISQCLDFIQQHLVNTRDHMLGKSIKATGGGAYKYTELIHDKLGLSVDKEDELSCLIKGCNFLLRNMTDEAFTFCRNANPEYMFMKAQPNIFPYMLVNIGSGVSILKVESEDKYERIGGTATGGGTFWGLGKLLTSAKGFDELLDLAEKGDHRNLDMLVKDIYGGDYELLGLPGDLIASSFGKAMHAKKDSSEYSEADIARSLLFTISNDIGQIACLYAMMYKMPRIYFGGYFLRGHPLSMHSISFAINYWGRGEVQALFLRHEGYLGAIGAFLKGAEECDSDKYSWKENLAGSAQELNFTIEPFETVPVTPPANLILGQLEMDRWEHPVTSLPFLADPDNYIPDTVDLNKDTEARDYWIQCFRDATGKYVDRAIQSQPHSETAEKRAHKFRDKYLSRLQYLQEKPFAYGNLTVRSLLDTIEHLLKEFDFPDPYLMQKKQENEIAMALLPQRLQHLDKMSEINRRTELIRAILAGNMFDWGAKEVAALMSQNGFGFEEAMSKLQERPWLVDGLDQWLQRMKGPAHKCAAIFVDNSGFDIVLGIIPFARELLKRGTRVILCANSAPALNDVTHSELQELLRQVGVMCPIIQSALQSSRLLAMGTAQAGPCLDLRQVCRGLTKTLVQNEVDLIVLEGMGRALHTNLTAKFTCECLKVAVIKNRWLANRLGGDMFSVICKFEPEAID